MAAGVSAKKFKFFQEEYFSRDPKGEQKQVLYQDEKVYFNMLIMMNVFWMISIIYIVDTRLYNNDEMRVLNEDHQ